MTAGFLKSQVRSGREEGGEENKTITQYEPKEKNNALLLPSFL